jgi:LAO/AO transport system kinase
MADILVVNKADGDRRQLAALAQAHYRNAVHLLAPHPGKWTPQVLISSATEHTGIEKIWETILEYHQITTENGYWRDNRHQQSHDWLHETLSGGFRRLFYEHPFIQSELIAIEPEVIAGRISPFAAARRILAQFKSTFLKQ